MVTSIKASTGILIITAFTALLFNGCEMNEEPELQPEIVITNPENNSEIVRGATIKITARLKNLNRYYKVHRITLKAGD